MKAIAIDLLDTGDVRVSVHNYYYVDSDTKQLFTGDDAGLFVLSVFDRRNGGDPENSYAGLVSPEDLLELAENLSKLMDDMTKGD